MKETHSFIVDSMRTGVADLLPEGERAIRRAPQWRCTACGSWRIFGAERLAITRVDICTNTPTALVRVMDIMLLRKDLNDLLTGYVSSASVRELQCEIEHRAHPGTRYAWCLDRERWIDDYGPAEAPGKVCGLCGKAIVTPSVHPHRVVLRSEAERAMVQQNRVGALVVCRAVAERLVAARISGLRLHPIPIVESLSGEAADE